MALYDGAVRLQRDVLSTAIRSLTAAVSIARAAKSGRSSTVARLYWRCARNQRCVPGTFRFPFGRIHYVDIQSLLSQYQDIFLSRVYEVSMLTRAPYIVDCGGNIGLSVIWFKQKYPHARVMVFEADPAIAGVLESNIHNLRLEDVEVIPAALDLDTGSVTFHTDGADGGRVGNGDGLIVECVRLSDRISEPVDILKVDVEGSEYGIIRDLCNTGKIGLIRHIICELHGYEATQRQIGALWNDLSNAGFRITVTSAHTAEWMPGPPDPTPFPSAQSAKFLLHLHAWQVERSDPRDVSGTMI